MAAKLGEANGLLESVEGCCFVWKEKDYKQEMRREKQKHFLEMILLFYYGWIANYTNANYYGVV